MLLAILGVGAFLALIFGPQFWIKWVMEKHAIEQPEFPGTGGELARHLLDRAGLKDVKLERIDEGDHYSPGRNCEAFQRNFDGNR
jgi:Zn-dependent membrane protease YugP